MKIRIKSEIVIDRVKFIRKIKGAANERHVLEIPGVTTLNMGVLKRK